MKTLRFFTVLWLASRACAAASDTAPRLLDRAAALAAAAQVTIERYPDANEVLVDGLQRVVYEPDGTFEQWHEDYIKALTEEGRRGLTTLSSYFTIPYQRGPEDCRIERAEIIKPDGRVVEIDVEAQSRVMVDPSAMSMNIYNPNSRVVRLNVPGLEVGDVLHYLMYDRVVKARMENSWSDGFVLEGTHPILRSAVEILAPADALPRSIVLKDEIAGTVAARVGDENGRRLYRWEANGVPRIFPEPNMPPVHTVVQRLLLSTLSDWQSVSRWYWRLSEPRYESTDEMRAKTAERIEGLDDPLSRIKALFRFVSQEIRYMGITVEANAPGYEPHDVKDTFEARHGVCRDKAALLTVMLRLAGFEAFPALIHYGAKKDAEVPQPYFNHAIVAVRYGALEDGGVVDETGRSLALLPSPSGHAYLLMDPTYETTATLLPAFLNDRSVLVATPEGEPLLTSPVDPAENNLMGIVTRGRIDAAGRLRAQTDMAFEGVNDNAYRGHFARSRPEDRRRFVEGLIREAVPGARVTDIELVPEDMLDTSRALFVRAWYEADSPLVTGGGETLLPLPLFGANVGTVNFSIGKTGLKQRRFPLVTEIAGGMTEDLSIELDSAVGGIVSLPAVSSAAHPSFGWAMEVTASGGVVRAAADFRLHAVEFSPRDYLELKRGLAAIETARRGMPILSDAAADAAVRGDVAVIREEAAYELADALNWTDVSSVSKRILTYAGRRSHAEIKIAYNPAWEDVSLEDVRVTDSGGTEHALQAREVNVMDAPWVGAAPRYPAGKILVASLPGVDIGSRIEYRIVRKVANRPFFAAYHVFRGFDEIERKSVSLSAPAVLDVRSGGVAFEGDRAVERIRVRGEDRVVHRWTAERAAPAEKEDALPPDWVFHPAVFLSAGHWVGYAAELARTLTGAAQGQREAGRVARELARSARDPLDTIRAIRDFVAVRVRDAGPNLPDLPLSAVTPADRTLLDGYGNTTDRGVLLHAMLCEAGFHPEFVLASSLPDVAPCREAVAGYPDPGLFPEVLVRVSGGEIEWPPDRYVYLNDTDQYAAVGASRHEGRLGLLLPDGALLRIEPAERSLLETDYKLVLSAQGETEITKTLRFHGNHYGPENKRYTEMTPEERSRHFQELVAGISQGAEALGELTTDFSGHPGTVSFTVKAREYAVRMGDRLYFQFPELFDGLFALRSGARHHPMYLPQAHHRKLTVLSRLPPGFDVVSFTEDWTCNDVGGAVIDVSAQVTEEDGGTGRLALWMEAEARTEPAVVSASHYHALLDIDRRLAHPRGRTVLLRKRL